MEVRKDFGSRMAALAEDIPREVVGALLKKLMPRKPVAKRAPRELETLAEDDAAALAGPQPRLFRAKAARKRLPRGQVLRSRIVVTLKGRRKLNRVGMDDKLSIITSAATVGEALRLAGIQYGDITYAARCGYIKLEGED